MEYAEITARAELIRAVLRAIVNDYADESSPHHAADGELADELILDAARDLVAAVDIGVSYDELRRLALTAGTRVVWGGDNPWHGTVVERTEEYARVRWDESDLTGLFQRNSIGTLRIERPDADSQVRS